jgi:glycogen phosphorylase
VPAGWLAKVGQSMTTLTPRFFVHRAVRQYAAEFYVPAAKTYVARLGEHGKLGSRLVKERQALEKGWPSLPFGTFQVETGEGQHHFRLEVNFGEVDPGAVLVELSAGGPDREPCRQPMEQGDKLPDRQGSLVYTARVAAARPAGDFTPPADPQN